MLTVLRGAREHWWYSVELGRARHQSERAGRPLDLGHEVIGDDLGINSSFCRSLHDSPRRRQVLKSIDPVGEVSRSEDLVDHGNTFAPVGVSGRDGGEARVVEEVLAVDGMAEVLEVMFRLDPCKIDEATVARGKAATRAFGSSA